MKFQGFRGELGPQIRRQHKNTVTWCLPAALIL